MVFVRALQSLAWSLGACLALVGCVFDSTPDQAQEDEPATVRGLSTPLVALQPDAAKDGIEVTAAELSRENGRIVVRGELQDGQSVEIAADKVELARGGGFLALPSSPVDSESTARARRPLICYCEGYSTSEGSVGFGIACYCF